MKKVNKKSVKKQATKKKVSPQANKEPEFCTFGKTLFPERKGWFSHIGTYAGKELVCFQTVLDMFVKRMSQYEQQRNNASNKNEKLFTFEDVVSVTTIAYAIGGIIGAYHGQDISKELSRIATKFNELDTEAVVAKKVNDSVRVVEGKSADEIIAKIADELRATLSQKPAVN